MSNKSNRGGGQTGHRSSDQGNPADASENLRSADQDRTGGDHEGSAAGDIGISDSPRGTQPDRKPGQRDDSGIDNSHH